MTTSPTTRRWFLPALAVAGFSLLALLYGVQISIYRASRGEPVSWAEALGSGAVEWFSWALLVPLIAALFERTVAWRWPWRLGIHAVASLGFGLVHLALVASGRHVFLGLSRTWREAWGDFLFLLSKTTDFEVLVYFAIVGALLALRSIRALAERELRASQLEAQLAQAQLQLLRSQLHPHFLFNALHGISALMHQDVEAADRMVSRLSELLRASLEGASAGRHEISLAEELALLAPYLDIEQTRFSDRLRVRLEVPEEIRGARVPALLLQPLVENAIRHGIAPRRGPGEVVVRAERVAERLELEVRDDGVGPPRELREGVGLRNTRARIERLYGPLGAVELVPGQPRGFIARLTLPFRSSTA
ncbi:histidine kinase [Archangium violaceum]|uniref:sensor histidine kinase n=1 Tax=Archangium violaceum TaxID=83451 RepID=UPI0019502E43|nr:histidine kinase [Archangium violaceum]QRN95246.1 histidine kinase [Archangium violaceum]